MLTEIGAENNTTTIIMMPSDFMNLAKTLTDTIQNKTIELPKKLSFLGYFWGAPF